MKLLVASRNKKKLAELDRILASAGIESVELLSLSDVEEYPERPEDGFSFEDNAFIKATDGAKYTGLACIADDSGLSVDELRGMPGVLSARWSGVHGNDQANNDLVLAQLSDTPDERRGGSFNSVCAIVVPNAGHHAEAFRRFVAQEGVVKQVREGTADSGILRIDSADNGDLLVSAQGVWRGRLLREEVGENGFGYDPLFVPAEEDERASAEGGAARSSAQLSAEEKDALSHRGRALRSLAPVLGALAEL